jgi:hypothetical protein
MTDTNELQRIADSAVKRAQEIVAATEWDGDMRVNITTIIGAGRVLNKRLQEREAELAALRAKVEEAIRVCRVHSHSGINVGAHSLALKLLKILEGEA